MKKLKYLALLTVNLIAVAGLYIGCVTSHNPSLLVVMPIYQILCLFGICGYVFLFLRHNNEIGKAKMNGREIDEQLLQKRRDGMKWFIVVFFPFVAVTVCDYIYILLLAENKTFQAIIELFR